MKFKALCFVALLVLNTLSNARAQTPAIGSLGDTLTGTPAPDSIHGWEFIPKSAITVTHLGLLDVVLGSALGIADNHPIGLFRVSDAQALSTGLIALGLGGQLIDDFRYFDVPDVTLTPGESYVISYFTPANASLTGDECVVRGAFTTHPEIEYVTARWGDASALGIPPNTTLETRFGPNFLFNVPEPSGLLILATTATAVGGASRRRR